MVRVDRERADEDVDRRRVGRSASSARETVTTSQPACRRWRNGSSRCRRSGPAVGADAGALGAEAVRLREPDQAPAAAAEAPAGAVVVLCRAACRRSRRTATPRRRRRIPGPGSSDRASSTSCRRRRCSGRRPVPGRRRVPSRLPTATIERFQNSISHSRFWSATPWPRYSVGCRCAIRVDPVERLAERRGRLAADRVRPGGGRDLAGEIPADDEDARAMPTTTAARPSAVGDVAQPSRAADPTAAIASISHWAKTGVQSEEPVRLLQDREAERVRVQLDAHLIRRRDEIQRTSPSSRRGCKGVRIDAAALEHERRADEEERRDVDDVSLLDARGEDGREIRRLQDV